MTEVKKPPFAAMIAKTDTFGRPGSIGIMGGPGTGKTLIAGGIIKVPGFKKMLYLDIDNGTEVFVNDPEVYQAVQDGRIDIVPIDKLDPEAFGKIQYFLGHRDEEKGEFIRGEAFNPEWGYDVVVLDALDVAQETAVDWYLTNTFNEKDQLDTRKAWGLISKWTSDMAWALQNDRRITGVLVMHTKEGTEENGSFSIRPKLQGSVKDSIGGIPSLMVHFEWERDDEGNKRVVATLGGDDVIRATKNRYNLPDKMHGFTLPAFYESLGKRVTEINNRNKPQPVKAAA